MFTRPYSKFCASKLRYLPGVARVREPCDPRHRVGGVVDDDSHQTKSKDLAPVVGSSVDVVVPML